MKMKKILSLFVALVLVVGMTGCTNTGKSFFGVVKNVVIGDDYEAAGRMVGNAGYMAYVIMKGDPKYDKYTAKAEEIYAALDNAESFDTATVNQVFLEILQAALTARYGYFKAVAITNGVRIGGVVADRLILKNVSATDANLYVKGLKEGIDEARADTPIEALDAAAASYKEKAEKAKNEASAKYIVCEAGKPCDLDFSKMRSTAKQLVLANEIMAGVKEGKYLDPAEQRDAELNPTKYENLVDFIERTTNMKKFKVKKLRCWIGKVHVTAEGKMDVLEFLWEDEEGNILVCKCTGCVGDYELLDAELE